MTRRCDLCGSEAVAVFVLPGGCIARPDLTRQALCLHHYVRSTPLDGMRLLEDLTPGGGFGRWLEAYLRGES